MLGLGELRGEHRASAAWGSRGRRRAILLSAVLGLAGIFGTVAAPATFAQASRFGTVQGLVTDQGGQPLNGVCLHLFDVKYTTDLVQFAPTGTSPGQPGFFTQANVPVGKYIGLFMNCGANTNGTLDPNYVTIFYGGTFKPKHAVHIVVTNNTTTTLSTTPIALGGTITGTVSDSTAAQPAWPLVVQAQIPGALSYNAFQTILTVCADTDGTYSISGVPTTGVNIVFAPAGWSCPDNTGTFVEPFNPSSYPTRVRPPSDGTRAGINGTVTENGSPFVHTHGHTALTRNTKPAHRT